MLRAIGILITCRNDFGFGRCMRHRHGVDKLAQNEAAQEEQRHRPALENKSPHTCRVTTGRIPRNGWLVSLVGLSAVALLAAGSLSFAAEAVKQDSEVAAEYKSEAAQLRDKAEHHRKLAANYKSRTPPKGPGSYASVAQHCEKLAKYYEEAAKEAEAVSSELSKQ